jgi:polyribonucleotide nucleotidyltransferase
MVAEVGKIYQGPIAKIADFGAFVTFMGGNDGLVHISEIENRRFETMADTGLSEGQVVYVKLLGMDRGKYKLSMKVVDQNTGEDLDPEGTHSFKPREGGDKREGRRDGRREGGRDGERRPRRANG